MTVSIAIVGAGYVADMYLQTLPAHDIQLAGVYDRDPARLAAFCAHHRVTAFPSLDALLADVRVGMVVNLTNPREHYAVSRAALEAGRHVYSEKPLATTLDDARALVTLAKARGLHLAAAPCNHLGNAVATLCRTVNDGRLGRVILAYAAMDDGMIPGLAYGSWRSRSGAPWPARDEFEVGCVNEHAGYQIAPLVALFGPVRTVTRFAAVEMPEKGPELALGPQGPDFSVGVLTFDHGVAARLTCSILAPADRSLRVIGTDGVATLADVWEYDSPVRVSRTGMALPSRLARKAEQKLHRAAPGLMRGRRVRHDGPRAVKTQGGHHMDFARGIAQLADAIGRVPPGPGAALALHITEVTLALQDDGPAVRTIGDCTPAV